MERLNSIVSEAIKKYGNKSVGVFIISYDEITPILIQSSMYNSLGKSDGMAVIVSLRIITLQRI